ncbi:glycosyl transferase family 1 [Chryseobacterium sp. Leaf404]|uniref:glycosyltransferase n=1 Tax=unclassified Chryseobacterium TaxID=2593645 RepID=UPI0006F4C14B|nr:MULTISPECIES: glycosyltransferase [unclassified Chryseobacterium]KQT22112.1 glycosyl transferase family 1 [Chryseobacterium sp. Leaf404]
MQKVLFLTTAHHPKDDRIYYHQAKSLAENGFEVKITSLCENLIEVSDNLQIESYSILNQSFQEKVEVFLKVCKCFQPDMIICSEPLAVSAAKKFQKTKKTSVIYDVTEWYPAMSMLSPIPYPAKIFQALKFFMINLYAGFLSSDFIFGEDTKKFPLAYFFPFKRYIILPYYPDPKFIFSNINSLNSNEITVCYTGQISQDKGIGNFFKAIDLVRKKDNDVKIKILIIGSARNEEDKIYFEKILSEYQFENIEIKKPTTFEKFTESFAEADLCFDLRELNFENNHSLPIKLFYYIGAGKPVIYSDLKGIRKHIDVSEFGFLVKPDNAEKIADIILNYVKNSKIYHDHAQKASEVFREKYNWNVIRDSFIQFIKTDR